MHETAVITPHDLINLQAQRLLTLCGTPLKSYAGEPITVNVIDHCLPEAVAQCLTELSNCDWIAFERRTLLGHQFRIGRAGELSLAETRSQTVVSRFLERMTRFVSRCS